jgi:muconolactone delta-isomerase
MSLGFTLGREEEPFTVGERTYRLSSPTLRAYTVVENEVRRHLANPLRKAAELAKSIPADQHQAFWAEAWRQEKEWASIDVFSLLDPRMQLAAMAMMCLHRYHAAEFSTLDKVLQWLETVDLEALITALNKVNPSPPGKKEDPTTGPSIGPSSSETLSK